MAGKRDALWVADTIITLLKSDLSSELDALEAEYSDGVILDNIPDSNYAISEQAALPSFPFIVVIPDQTDLLPFDGEFRYGIEYHYLTISVARTANEGEDLLKRQTLRTLRGIEQVLIGNRTLNSQVDDVLLLQKEYGPLVTDSGALMQEAQLYVRVQSRNEYDS